jgi:hypothetical protein
MSLERSPVFCDAALAERIERVEADLIARASEAAGRRGARTAGFVIAIAGGMATFAEEGSPFNKVAGLGFRGLPSAAMGSCRLRTCLDLPSTASQSE